MKVANKIKGWLSHKRAEFKKMSKFQKFDYLSDYSTAIKSDWLGAQEITTKNVILTWATTQEKITVRISRPR